jgi:hypothetical protein
MSGYGETYTRKDMDDSPYWYSILGWIFTYCALAAFSPILLFFRSMELEASFLTMTIMFGIIIWGMGIAYLLVDGRHLLKSLTKVLRNFYKKALGLPAQNLTASEFQN